MKMTIYCMCLIGLIVAGCSTAPRPAAVPEAAPSGSTQMNPGSQTPAGTTQTLWQQARYGMTREQVRTAFPNSRDRSVKIGKLAFVVVEDDTEIAGFPFHVEFYFSAPDAGLGRVVLRCTERLLNDRGAAVARKFVELIQSQHGEGKTSEDQDSDDPRDIDRVWITKDLTQIRLSFFKDASLGVGAYLLSITYDGNELRGADKL